MARQERLSRKNIQSDAKRLSTLIASVTGAAGPHAFLSATHSDTATTVLTQGDIVVAGAASWDALGIGGAGTFLKSDGTDPAWATPVIADISDLAYGTPALTFGTANAAGAASTVMRTDATLAAFDATVPTTIVVGASAAAGAAGVTARRDHTHGITTSSSPGAVAAILACDASGFLTLPKLTITTAVDLNGTLEGLILDADADTSIDAHNDDVISINIAGSTDFTFTTNSFDVLGSSGIRMASGTWIGINGEHGCIVFDDLTPDLIRFSNCDVTMGELTIRIGGNDDFTFTANSFNVSIGSYITMADDTWIGLGAAAGRMEFDDQAMDVIKFLDCIVDLTAASFSGATGANVVTVPDNLADALHLIDAGGADDYITVVSTNAQREVVINQDGADIDFRVEVVGQVNGLFVRASDGSVGINGIPNTAAKLHVRGGSIWLDNARGLEALDAGGTQRNLLSLDAGNNVNVGSYTTGQFLHLISGGGGVRVLTSGAAIAALFTDTGRFSVGTGAPAGQAHIDQSSTTAAIPVLLLDQADLSEEFIELTTTVGAGNPIDTAAIGTYYGKMRVSVTGVGYKYIALYNS